MVLVKMRNKSILSSVTFEVKLPFVGWRFQWRVSRGSSSVAKIREQIEHHPDDPKHHLYLVSLLIEANRLEEAVKVLQTALSLLPRDQDVVDDPVLSQDNAWAHYLFGRILAQGGAHEQAITEWEKAESLNKLVIGELARSKIKLFRQE